MNFKHPIITLLFLFSVSCFSQDAKKDSVKTLLESANKTLFDSPEKSVLYLKKVRTLISSNNNLSKYYYLEAYANFNLGNIGQAEIYCDSVFSVQQRSKELNAKNYSLLSVIYRKKGHYKKAIVNANNAIAIYKKTNDSDGLNNGYLNLGKIYHYSGENQKALSLFLKSLSYYKTKKNTFKQGQILSIISSVYAEIDEKEKAKKYALEGINLLKNHPNSVIYADALNNYGIFFYDEKNYSKAVYYFAQALRVYKTINVEDAIAAAQQNLGISYIHLNHFKEGFKALHASLKTFKKLHLKDEVSVLTDLGVAHTIANNIDSAQYYHNLAYKKADKENYAYYKKENLRLLFELFEKNKNYDSALYYFKLYTGYKDSLNNNKLRKTIAELEIKYNTSEKEKEIISLKGKELINKANNRLLLISLISLGILSVVVVYKIQNRRKKEKKIQQQQLIIQQKEEELLKNKLKKVELEDEKLKQELEFKTKQLTTHAINMMQKNQLLQEVYQEISETVQKASETNKKELFKIKKHLENTFKTEQDWELFKIYFEQINKSFFSKLKNINSKLTVNDYRLCALLKLNMSLKEMANVLGISPNSVKNARYRLKKKLKLSASQDLKEFIAKL